METFLDGDLASTSHPHWGGLTVGGQSMVGSGGAAGGGGHNTNSEGCNAGHGGRGGGAIFISARTIVAKNTSPTGAIRADGEGGLPRTKEESEGWPCTHSDWASNSQTGGGGGGSGGFVGIISGSDFGCVSSPLRPPPPPCHPPTSVLPSPIHCPIRYSATPVNSC